MAVFNFFRLVGDLLHLLSILLLIEKIRRHKTCAGISLKSQLLFALVFSTRYLDIFFNFFSVYNSIMKIIFLSCSYYTVYLIAVKYKYTYDKEHDTFRVLFIVIPCAVLALIFHEQFTVFEVLWAFSIFLEALSIMPQLFLLRRTGEIEAITSHYIAALGGYRLFYLFNWVLRYYTEDRESHWMIWLCGTLQTALYGDFFYYYFMSKWYGKKLVLPS